VPESILSIVSAAHTPTDMTTATRAAASTPQRPAPRR
jgi:hypothetical protein